MQSDFASAKISVVRNTCP